MLLESPRSKYKVHTKIEYIYASTFILTKKGAHISIYKRKAFNDIKRAYIIEE